MHITRSAAIAAALTPVVLLGVVAAAPIVTPRSRLTASARVEAADTLTLPPEIPMTRFDFENGSLDGWKTVDGRWAVEEMTGAPSGKRVLVQQATANAFNVIVAPGGPYTDVDVSMRFKPLSGREDASGGIVFRFLDGHYYVVRANALEGNFRLYYYDRGRREIASARVQPPALGRWHSMRVVAVADHIQAYLNGTLLLDHRDTRFRAGQVGLWTKADSMTAFDDLEVRGVRAGGYTRGDLGRPTMSVEHIGYIELPGHDKPGGFDHAAVHGGLGRLYVAHTANSALDVIDCLAQRYLHSIPGLSGVAGVLVSEDQNLLFTSNRQANTVGILSAATGDLLGEVPVGIGPNGLAYYAAQQLLLAANVGDVATPGSQTVSLVDVRTKTLRGYVYVPGRTRWALFEPATDAFYVNIADPPEIAVIEAQRPDHIHRTFPIPANGPHGLDLDARAHRLFCACDGKVVVALDAETGRITDQGNLSGAPDVIFFNAERKHLYVAVGDPGVFEVWDTEPLRRLEIVSTEQGAYTIGFDPIRNTVYAFLPKSHRAAIYRDSA